MLLREPSTLYGKGRKASSVRHYSVEEVSLRAINAGKWKKFLAALVDVLDVFAVKSSLSNLPVVEMRFAQEKPERNPLGRGICRCLKFGISMHGS
jgi:hypothetical protein